MDRDGLIEQLSEKLYRVHEMRMWVQSNVLFPAVPDLLVRPLREQLLQVEHVLVAQLYDLEALDRADAILKATVR